MGAEAAASYKLVAVIDGDTPLIMIATYGTRDGITLQHLSQSYHSQQRILRNGFAIAIRWTYFTNVTRIFQRRTPTSSFLPKRWAYTRIPPHSSRHHPNTIHLIPYFPQTQLTPHRTSPAPASVGTSIVEKSLPFFLLDCPSLVRNDTKEEYTVGIAGFPVGH